MPGFVNLLDRAYKLLQNIGESFENMSVAATVQKLACCIHVHDDSATCS